MELKLKNKVFNKSKEKISDKEERFNRVSKKTNFVLNILFAVDGIF